MTLALPLPSPRDERTARLATLGSTARATAVTTVEYASSASSSIGQAVFGHNPVSAIARTRYAAVRHRQNSAPFEHHLAADDGGGHHVRVEVSQHLGGRRRQHTQVAGLARLDACGLQPAGRGGRGTSSKPLTPRRIRRRPARRRCRFCDAPRRASPPTGRRRRTAYRWTAPPARRRAAARPAATTGAARLRGRRRGTGRRARRRSWAGSPPSHRARPGPRGCPRGTTAACSIRSRGWLPADAQRREGDDELGGGHAMHGDRAAGVMAVGDPRGELVEVEVGHRAGCAFPGARQCTRCRSSPCRCASTNSTMSPAPRSGVASVTPVMPYPAQPPAQLRQVDFALPQGIRPVRGPRCAAGRRGDRAAPPGPAPPSSGSTARRCGAARAPVVCGTRASSCVAVQVTGDRLVVADRPDPAVGTGLGGRQRGGDSGARSDRSAVRPIPNHAPRRPSTGGRGGRAGPG